MKRTSLLLPSLLFVAGLLLAVAPRALQGQTPNAFPPPFMTYQGYLTDGNGVALATNAPKNYDVIFRLYTASTGGAEVWAEEQTVTVDKGYFSVLLGEGSQYNSEVHPALAGLFATNNASDRYVEMTVKGIGAGGSDTTILPRLRLMTSPYAFLAQTANTVDGSALTSGTVSDSRLSSNVALRSGGNTFSGNQIFNNNLGIGTASPNYPLNFGSSLGDKISLYGNSGGHYGFGVQGSLLQIYTDSANSDVAFGFGSSGSMGETMRIKGNGNVGIGTSSPGFRLSLGSDNINTKLAIWDGGTTAMGFGVGSAQFRIHLPSSNNRFSFLNAPNGTEVMTIQGGGNVGIGVISPAAPLHVTSAGWPTEIVDGSSTVGTWFNLANSSAGGTNWHIISSGSANGEGAGKLLFASGGVGSVNAEPLVLTPAGVGIGTASPTKAALEVDGYQNYSVSDYTYLHDNSSNPTGYVSGSGGSQPYSVYAAGRVAASEFNAFSDARIKNIKGQSDSQKDLATLLKIKVTDYTMRDTVTKGNRSIKKVIGQEVEAVYPQAVTRTTDVVPDIYTRAEAKAGWITLDKHLEPALKIGDKVRLITDKKTDLFEITEVNSDGFRVKQPLTGPVFVFGREVNDFRTVDYNAIAMLNVSATQELYRELHEKTAELTAVKQKLSAIESLEKELVGLKKQLATQAAARDARLDALEEQLHHQQAQNGVRSAKYVSNEQ